MRRKRSSSGDAWRLLSDGVVGRFATLDEVRATATLDLILRPGKRTNLWSKFS